MAFATDCHKHLIVVPPPTRQRRHSTHPPERPRGPGEFADDQTVAALEDVHQFVELAALFGSLSRGGRLDEVVDAEVVFVCVLEDGEALAAHVQQRGRDPQIGNGFHGLTMEYGFWYFI